MDKATIDLLYRAKVYWAYLAPHAKDRQGGQLFKELMDALSAIEQREGWVMVPKEPSKRMLMAALPALDDAEDGTFTKGEAAALIYKAMLAAAEPPAAPGKG